MLIRRINPNRVHLATDLVYNPDGSTQVNYLNSQTLEIKAFSADVFSS